MRVHITGSQSAALFADQLLQLGNGTLSTENNQGSLPFGHSVGNIEELIISVFPCLQQKHQECEWLCERAILAPRNLEVDAINEQLLNILPGNHKV